MWIHRCSCIYIEGRARPTFAARAILRLCNGGVSWRQQNAERTLAFDFKTTAESRPEKYGRPRHSQRAAGGPTTSFQNNVRCSVFGICVEEEEEEIIQGRRKKNRARNRRDVNRRKQSEETTQGRRIVGVEPKTVE